MHPTEGFVLVAITAIGIVVVILVAMGRAGHRRRRITPMGGVAFACVVAGLVLGDDGRIGYALLGAGVLLSVLDAVLRLRDRT
jgi:hypothetical protein